MARQLQAGRRRPHAIPEVHRRRRREVSAHEFQRSGAEMKEKQKTRPCPSCGGVMRRGLRDEIITYGNASLKYQQPGWHCTSCDDGVLEGVDNEYHDAALHEVMARAKRSPISPLLIRAARHAVGVSQREPPGTSCRRRTPFYI